MTRKLDVKILVETLNELFGKFDDASEVCYFNNLLINPFNSHFGVIKTFQN